MQLKIPNPQQIMSFDELLSLIEAEVGAEIPRKRQRRGTAIPAEPFKREKFYRFLLEDKFGQDFEEFSCPHCHVGKGEFAYNGQWSCLECPARGTNESLAITLEIDPQIPQRS